MMRHSLSAHSQIKQVINVDQDKTWSSAHSTTRTPSRHTGRTVDARKIPTTSVRTLTTLYNLLQTALIIFRVVRRSRGEMYIGHARLCVCLSLAAFPHYCTDPDVTWANGRGCPLVVHCWADLQSVHGFRCCDNIARTRNVSERLYRSMPG